MSDDDELKVEWSAPLTEYLSDSTRRLSQSSTKSSRSSTQLPRSSKSDFDDVVGIDILRSDDKWKLPKTSGLFKEGLKFPKRASYDGGNLLWKNIRGWSEKHKWIRWLCSLFIMLAFFTLVILSESLHWSSIDVSEASRELPEVFKFRVAENFAIPLAAFSYLLCAALALLMYAVICLLKERFTILTRFQWIASALLLLKLVSIQLTAIPTQHMECTLMQSLVEQSSQLRSFWFSFWCSGQQSLISMPLLFGQLSVQILVLYTSTHWTLKLFWWLVVLFVWCLFISLRLVYSMDLMLTALMTFLVSYVYHQAIITYHSYAKLGWLKYDWTNPHLLLLRLVWYLDGLDFKRFRHSPVPSI